MLIQNSFLGPSRFASSSSLAQAGRCWRLAVGAAGGALLAVGAAGGELLAVVAAGGGSLKVASEGGAG